MNLNELFIASVDVESTGLDASTDRIITLGVCIGGPHRITKRHEWKFNPQRPIPVEATKIHGITDTNVANLLPFSRDAAESFLAMIDKCKVITGYNVAKFDIPIIMEELKRIGCCNHFPKQGVHVIDAMVIFKQKEQRTLTAAVQKFCGRQHVEAHSAAADAEASLDVLFGELQAYPDLQMLTPKELADWCGQDKLVDYAGILERREDGEIVFTHKKVKGIPVKADPGYANWILRSQFSSDTKRHIRKILQEMNNEGGLFD